MNSRPSEALPGAGKIARAVIVLGFVLLALGITSVWNGSALLRASGERAELPVKLQAGQEFRTTFKTSAKLPMALQLVLTRHEGVSDDVMDEVLSRETNALNIEWFVRKYGTNIFSGSSTNAKGLSFSASYKAKTIGSFTPRHSGTYELVAKVYSDLPGSEQAHPRVTIRPNIPRAMSASIRGSVAVIGGIVFGLIGLIVIFLARRERRAVAQSG